MMNPGAYLEELLDHLEEEAVRLPRPWGYLLIFAISGLLWIPIGIVMLKLAKWLA